MVPTHCEHLLGCSSLSVLISNEGMGLKKVSSAAQIVKLLVSQAVCYYNPQLVISYWHVEAPAL